MVERILPAEIAAPVEKQMSHRHPITILHTTPHHTRAETVAAEAVPIHLVIPMLQ